MGEGGGGRSAAIAHYYVLVFHSMYILFLSRICVCGL
jgi:hypothetical protein